MIAREERLFRKELRKILGFRPHDLALYHQAFEHCSLKGTGNPERHRHPDNERLEYLGDAVLESVCSDYLYHRYPKRDEGFLTTTRSKMVQRSTLGEVAKTMGLDTFIRATVSNSYHNNFLPGNAFEAFVGALYLDRGYRRSQQFLLRRVFGHAMDVERLAREEMNYKSRIIEWAQKHQYAFEYRLVDEQKDHGSPVFTSTLLIQGIECGTGTGFTKRESQQKASQEAYTRVKNSRNSLAEQLKAAKKAEEKTEICE